MPYTPRAPQDRIQALRARFHEEGFKKIANRDLNIANTASGGALLRDGVSPERARAIRVAARASQNNPTR